VDLIAANRKVVAVGLWGRRKNAEGLYVGDAPVSAPGVDGAAPTAYLAPGSAGVGDSAATPTRGPDVSLMTPGYQAEAPVAQPPTTEIPAVKPPVARGRRRSVRGCLVGVVALAVAIGAVAYLVMKVATAVDTAIGSHGPSRTPVTATPLGEPVAVDYGGGRFEVTVFGATAQPGQAWSQAYRGDKPQLVVDAQLHRIDPGTDTIRVLGWDWSVASAGNDTSDGVSGDIISSFEPSLEGPDLAGGDTVRGFLTFDTAMKAATLSLRDGPTSSALATWQLTADTPDVAAGTVGVPLQPEISRPGFTVTIDDPRTVDDGIVAPESGRYLLMDLTVTPNPGVGSSLGLVDAASFVFVAEDGSEVPSEFGAVDGGLTVLLIDQHQSSGAVLAFDTVASAGTLQMRDVAGRTIATWQIRG